MNEVMRRRPMYRWKSFWLGVCVVAFLGWAWERSHRLEESCSVVWVAPYKGGGPNSTSLRQGWGKIHAAVEHEFAEPGIVGWVREINWELKDPQVIGFSTGDFTVSLVVAYWFLMVMFVVVWGGWLVWRWRRSRCL